VVRSLSNSTEEAGKLGRIKGRKKEEAFWGGAGQREGNYPGNALSGGRKILWGQI